LYGRFFCQTDGRNLSSRGEFLGRFHPCFWGYNTYCCTNLITALVGWFFCQTDGRNLSFRGEFPGVFIRVFGDTNA